MTVRELQEKLSKVSPDLEVVLEVHYRNYGQSGYSPVNHKESGTAWDVSTRPGQPDVKIYTDDQLTSHSGPTPGKLVIRNKFEDE